MSMPLMPLINASTKMQSFPYQLTHWDRVTHICVSNTTIIGSDNGLSPNQRQAIILTNTGILLIWPLGSNFSEIFIIEIHIFSFKKMHFKWSFVKWRPFCPGLNVLKPVELSPPFKNSDNLRIGNYRLDSVLTCISKVFKKVRRDHLHKFWQNKKKTQVLLQVIGNCKAALDRYEHICLQLMNLSKAFDWLSRHLLLSELHFMVCQNACTRLKSYLHNRKQRCKCGSARREFSICQKSVSQGSVLGFRMTSF